MAGEPVDPNSGAPEAARGDGTMDAAVEAEIARMQVEKPPRDESGTPDESDAGQDDDPNAPNDDDPAADPDEQQEAEGDDGESFEYEAADGKKYQLPKAVQEGVMLKADYTRKRQQESAYVQSVQQREQQLPQLFETAEHFQQERGALGWIDSQIQQLQQTNWAHLRQTDSLAYSEATGTLTLLQNQRQGLVQAMQEKGQQIQQHMERSRLQQAERTAKVLQDDHGWTRERHSAVQQTARKYLGHNPVVMQALHDGVDPAVFLMLEKVAKYDALEAGKPAAIQKARQATQRVNVRSGGGSQPSQRTGSTVQQAHGRLAKTGLVQDAVALELARMPGGGGRRR